MLPKPAAMRQLAADHKQEVPCLPATRVAQCVAERPLCFSAVSRGQQSGGRRGRRGRQRERGRGRKWRRRPSCHPNPPRGSPNSASLAACARQRQRQRQRRSAASLPSSDAAPRRTAVAGAAVVVTDPGGSRVSSRRSARHTHTHSQPPTPRPPFVSLVSALSLKKHHEPARTRPLTHPPTNPPPLTPAARQQHHPPPPPAAAP